MNAITVPVGAGPAKRVTLRQLVTDASGVGYLIAAPLITNSSYPMSPYEAVKLELPDTPGQKRFYYDGDTIGGIQPLSGSITFARFFE